MIANDNVLTQQLRILSPRSGRVWPLERVPDRVPVQKIVEDGLSIDPTDALLVARCDGEVVSLHAAAMRQLCGRKPGSIY